MPQWLWIALPLVVAGGTAVLVFILMQARADAAIAREKELLAEAQALLKTHEKLAVEQRQAAEEAGRRLAMDQFFGDLRVETRQFVRHTDSFWVRKRTLVLEERLFFRNLPLSDWVRREIVVEDGRQARGLTPPRSVFSLPALEAPQDTAIQALTKYEQDV